ncbi:MAG: ribosome maturation factor RimM [Bifidobacteriaceae bacterium]|jgi:16S rRNA processing protein RimM|nr:ribosome maturation factor RimM [Bifidobacteriaceae bacterium]
MEVVLAVIGRPHGIRGDVVLELRTDRPEARFAVGSAYSVDRPAPGQPERLTLRRFQAGPRQVVASFAEIRDRTAAESLRGAKLAAEVDPNDEADAWYPSQLRGAAVSLPDGTAVGVVKGLVMAPAQDLLEIDQADGSTALVPLVKQLVPVVDRKRMRVVIDPPAGLVAARPLAPTPTPAPATEPAAEPEPEPDPAKEGASDADRRHHDLP